MNIPLINGRRYSFASLEVTLVRNGTESEIFVDISDLNYGDALEMGDVEGTNVRKVGYTRGNYEPEDTTFSMAKSSFQTGIVEAIGDGWLGSNFKIVCKYADEGEPLTVDEIQGFLTGTSEGHSAGPDNLQVEVTMKTIMITRNGVKPVE